MPITGSKNGDIEAGNAGQLYPNMTERPDLRWAFIRKVYVILSVQLLVTVAVAAAVVFTRPIPEFIRHTSEGLAVFIVIIVLTIVVMLLLTKYQSSHPLNMILLGLLTVMISFSVGLSCSFSKGRIILEAGVLTAGVVISLTLYTFWAAKRGYDFNFLGPFLFASAMMLILFSLIQLLFPLGPLGRMVWGCLAAMIYSGYIVYDTDNLIKRFNYDEYVSAAICLYVDIIQLFLALLTILNGGER